MVRVAPASVPQLVLCAPSPASSASCVAGKSASCGRALVRAGARRRWQVPQGSTGPHRGTWMTVRGLASNAARGTCRLHRATWITRPQLSDGARRIRHRDTWMARAATIATTQADGVVQHQRAHNTIPCGSKSLSWVTRNYGCISIEAGTTNTCMCF